MRWRLCFFFLSATAAFCFLLLTAITSIDSGIQYQTPLVSATRGAPQLASATASASSIASTGISTDAISSGAAFDVLLKPNPAKLYVPANADPVMVRREAELAERANIAKPAYRKRLKADEYGWYREEVALVTAYCPCSKCCGSFANGITSIGKNAWSEGLAADPLYLDYGTKVMVPGYGMSVVDDTGGAMRRHWRRNGILHIDVRMTYHFEARQWGKQYLRVRIYDSE